jgi:hypothetical protein
MDLTRSVKYRNTELNSVTDSSDVLSGVRIDNADWSEVEWRQFMEPTALHDGLDIGPVYAGHRVIRLSGTVYGSTRKAAFEAIQALDALFAPTAPYVADATTFGYAPFVFYWHEGGVRVTKTFQVLSHGLRVVWRREWFGGSDRDPLAVPWTVMLVSNDPDGSTA